MGRPGGERGGDPCGSHRDGGDERACGGHGSDADNDTANYSAIIAEGENTTVERSDLI
jgi:hypothetical protein